VVEVAYYNMDRIRIVWSRIWQQMSQHFYKAGCHPNLRIAMYAVDSLRQLAIKFLEKEELASYQYQREFLNPFVLIIENNSLLDVHELVIRCLTQIVQVELPQTGTVLFRPHAWCVLTDVDCSAGTCKTATIRLGDYLAVFLTCSNNIFLDSLCAGIRNGGATGMRHACLSAVQCATVLWYSPPQTCLLHVSIRCLILHGGCR
jgi:hypothetical protein